MITAFTGHRPNKLGGYALDNPVRIRVCKRIEEALVELKPEEAISGMALGVDQWAAAICIPFGIPFIAAVPFVGQERVWPSESRAKYAELLEKASKVEIICDEGYAVWKMQKRNEWMVDRCHTLIAIWDGTSGGTGNCVEYAKSIGKNIYRIDPRE